MNQKQMAFCSHYVQSLNATQSAKDAGYSERTAYSIGQQLLNKLEIQNYIREIMDSKDESLVASENEILERLTRILRGQELETVVITLANGSVKTLEVPPKIKDRIRAGELLGKRRGLWIEKSNITLEVPVFIDDIPNEDEEEEN